jgi:hypothetical protein
MRSSPTLFLAVLTLFFSLSVAQDFSCSPTKPCPIGCCGNSGICGLGPTFCGAGNCTSTCDAKSDCDPGWGAKWSNAEKCPLNVCCSEFGASVSHFYISCYPHILTLQAFAEPHQCFAATRLSVHPRAQGAPPLTSGQSDIMRAGVIRGPATRCIRRTCPSARTRTSTLPLPS